MENTIKLGKIKKGFTFQNPANNKPVTPRRYRINIINGIKHLFISFKMRGAWMLWRLTIFPAWRQYQRAGLI